MTRKKGHLGAIATSTTPAVTFNINTILGGIGTILCGLILWILTGAMSANKETAKTVGIINTQLPYLQHAIDITAADVKEATAKMATQNQLNEKHNQLQESIKEVKQDVKEVKIEQTKVREELGKKIDDGKH